MEYQSWAYLGASGALGVIVWFLKRTITVNENNIDNMRRELAEVKLTYLRKDDFKDFKEELRNQLNEIKEMIRDIKHG